MPFTELHAPSSFGLNELLSLMNQKSEISILFAHLTGPDTYAEYYSANPTIRASFWDLNICE